MIQFFKLLKGVKEAGIMSLFKKKDSHKKHSKNSDERIIVKSGKNDIRSYPKPGTLLHVDLQQEVTGSMKSNS